MSDFTSYEDAYAILSPYATQIKKIKPTEITWAQYQQLTPQQKTDKRYVITDYPLYGEEICEIKGAYDTLAELEQAHPSGNSGDAYLVGSPSHIYVWLVDDEEWSDAGAFTSITGPQGATGVGVSSVNINSNNHLIVTFDDSTVHDAGEIQGGGGSAAWGSITGTLANQTDLSTVLEEKADTDDILDTSSMVNYNVLKVTDGNGSKNGLTWSKSDGVITLDGTVSGSADFTLGDNSSDGVLPDGKYAFSMEIISGTINSGKVEYTDNIQYITLGTGSAAVKTIANATRNKLFLGNGSSFSNLKIHVWANEGETAHEYQKWGQTESVKLKNSIEITRLDEHLADSTIHVTQADKDRWNGEDSIFASEISQIASDALQSINGRSLVFVMMADNHICPTAYTSGGVTKGAESLRQYKSEIGHIKNITRRIPVDAMVHLGDFVNTQWRWVNEPTDAEYQAYVAEYANMLRDTDIKNILIASGNHDGGLDGSSEYSSYDATYRECQKVTDTTCSEIARSGSDPWYYIDYDDLKLRCIFIYTNIDSSSSDYKGIQYAQALWFKQTLDALPNDYNVLMFGHIAFSMFYDGFSTAGASANFVALANGFNAHQVVDLDGSSLDSDFTSKTGHILAYMSGHYHGDRIIMENDVHAVFNFPEVVTASGSYVMDSVITSGSYYDASDAPSRTVGTITEDAFDIVVYCPSDSKIYFKRFGAGSDRVLNLS